MTEDHEGFVGSCREEQGKGERALAASAQLALGGVLRLQQRLKEAEDLCRQSLSLREELHNSQHPDVAASLTGTQSLPPVWDAPSINFPWLPTLIVTSFLVSTHSCYDGQLSTRKLLCCCIAQGLSCIFAFVIVSEGPGTPPYLHVRDNSESIICITYVVTIVPFSYHRYYYGLDYHHHHCY